MKIAINGFGRIGRNALRIAMERGIDVAVINDTADSKGLAHLFKYDSVRGTYRGDVRTTPEAMVIDGKEIPVIGVRDLTKVSWKGYNADVVIESTGKFTKGEEIKKHLDAGAKKVVVSAPAEGAESTIVIGVNDSNYKKEHKVISVASCTTNCLAPVAKVVNDNFGIEKGFVTTVHAYTNDQRLLDNNHKDLRRARAASLSMIPTTTGAAKSIGQIIPDLKGKMDGIAVRVPTPNVSLIDLVCSVRKPSDAKTVNEALKAASRGYLKGILDVCEEPLVSIDFNGNPYSAIVDSLSTMANGNMVKVMAWYDNEWAYSCRLMDCVELAMGLRK